MKKRADRHPCVIPSTLVLLKAMVSLEPVIFHFVNPKTQGSTEKRALLIGKMVAEESYLVRVENRLSIR